MTPRSVMKKSFLSLFIFSLMASVAFAEEAYTVPSTLDYTFQANEASLDQGFTPDNSPGSAYSIAEAAKQLNRGVSNDGNCDRPTNIGTLFAYAKCILEDYVIPFLFALALVVFLVGVTRYVAAGDNEEKRGQGRHIMLFGIIALFVMVSVWGFVKILTASFGFEFELPTLPEKSDKIFGD